MRKTSIFLLPVTLLVLLAADESNAAVSSDLLLPATTKGYVSIPDAERLEADFKKTQLGQLFADPIVKPFADDLKRQLQEKWSKQYEPLGITWADLQGVPSGEVAMARMRLSDTKAAVAVIADVTDRLEKANKLLTKIDENLHKKGAKKETVKQGDVELTVYTRETKDKEIHTAVIFVHAEHNQLVATDDMDAARDILRRFDGKATDNLAGVKAYQVAIERCTAQQGDVEPHVRWFVEPFGYVEAVRIANPRREVKKTRDLLQVLKNQGFTAVQGVGGLITLSDGTHDVMHHTMVYAPPVARKPGDDNSDKFDLAMRMLNFPNGGDHQPPSWIPRDLATFVSLNADIKNGFEYSKTLVNELADDEIFEDVLDSLKNDPSGPRVDVRKEVVANLADRIMVISDHQLPITPKSERLLVCIKLTDVDPVKKAVDKTMENDPNARKHDNVAGKYTVWEIVEEEAELPEFEFEFGFEEIDVPEDNKKNDNKTLPNAAVSVAHGHLLIASHMDFIVKVLKQAERRQTLAGSTDFQVIQRALENLGAESDSSRTFSRTDEEFRSTYELLKQGKMPESESLLGKLLNVVFDNGDDDTTRKQQLDGSKLPDYQMVRRYLGPAGLYARSLDDGWMVSGCFLSREVLQVVLKTE